MRNRETKQKVRIIKPKDAGETRRLLESGNYDIVLSPEAGKRKNTLRTIDSGMNEVLMGLAAKQGIALGIDVTELRMLSSQEQAERLTRIRQNLVLARKAHVKTVLIGSKTKQTGSALLRALGTSSQQAAQATDF